MSMRISCQDARELVNNGAQLLDVRAGYEFEEDAVPGAINIPLNMLPKYVGLLERAKPVVIYCRSGRRSATAANMLKMAGFSKVHDLGARQNYFAC